MRLDLRRMPMAELARLLRDIANELQARSNPGNWNSTGSAYNRATGYGPAFNGPYGANHQFGPKDFGADPSRFHRRRHRRHRSGGHSHHESRGHPPQESDASSDLGSEDAPPSSGG